MDTFKIVFSEKLDELVTSQMTIQMTDPTDGKLYTCIIPDIAPVEDVVDPLASSEEDKAISNSPWDVMSVLAPLEGNCMYRNDGWWNYEFCYGQAVRQFHVEKETVTAEYFLGRGPPKAIANTNPEYYADIYGSGTLCDLTSLPRTIEVQFKCSTDQQNTFIVSVKEASTCNYVLVVLTNLICRHPYYKPKEDSSATIVCIKPDSASNYFIGQPVASL